jgi:hypothetical protein
VDDLTTKPEAIDVSCFEINLVSSPFYLILIVQLSWVVLRETPYTWRGGGEVLERVEQEGRGEAHQRYPAYSQAQPSAMQPIELFDSKICSIEWLFLERHHTTRNTLSFISLAIPSRLHHRHRLRRKSSWAYASNLDSCYGCFWQSGFNLLCTFLRDEADKSSEEGDQRNKLELRIIMILQTEDTTSYGRFNTLLLMDFRI